ncbi:MAG: potassium channel family protein [Acetobacteraceae bacterium]|nr:potassium channel family protein [Acetobacteraceae bacterium]
MQARRFRFGLLMLDLGSLSFVALVSFLPRYEAVLGFEALLGLVLLAEFALRHLSSSRPVRDMLRPTHLADLAATLSLVAAPFVTHGLGFLRALRFLRVLNSVRLATSLGDDFPFFRRNEEAIIAAAQLVVFIFIMTGLVFETQIGRNDHIRNYGDALYFTVTALTTTGFGDITLPGTTGRLLSVAIMICGVTLFLRLAQALFRPSKVSFECPNCALMRHEPDAVHCKGCGAMLRIPDEGRD